MGLKILVTGSNGQLGKSLQAIAASFPDYEFIFTGQDELAIEKDAVVHYFFEKYLPDFCINCAAYTAVDKAETAKDICYTVNAIGPKNLAEIALQFQCKLIHLSTDYVFDGKQHTPYKETDVTNPINYYGISKLAGEGFVLQANPDSIIIRTSWLYSAFGNNFVKTMMRLMETKDPIKVVADQFGSPTYALSLATTILQIITQITSSDKKHNGIYHYSSESNISWFDFAKEIHHNMHSSCTIIPITTIDYPTPASRSLYSVLDKSKIKQDFHLSVNEWKTDLKACMDTLQNLTF